MPVYIAQSFVQACSLEGWCGGTSLAPCPGKSRSCKPQVNKPIFENPVDKSVMCPILHNPHSVISGPSPASNKFKENKSHSVSFSSYSLACFS